jgi:hypothetical protein
VSEDIIEKIDAALLAEKNSKRFDPFGEAWDEDRVERINDGMRVRPARTGIEEEPEQAEDAVGYELVASNAPEGATFNPATGAVSWSQNSSPWVSFADVAALAVVPSSDLGSSGGSAPIPAGHDHVANAFCEVVVGQGIDPHEAQEFLNGHWTALDETHLWLAANPALAAPAEPVTPHVDESLEPDRRSALPVVPERTEQ